MKIDRLDALIRQGQAFEKVLRDLSTQPGSDATKSWADFAAEVTRWLEACVRNGRFLPEVSPDRRALQGQVDYWTTRLRQAGHTQDSIELLADFDPKAGVPLMVDFPYFGLSAVTADERMFKDSGLPRFVGREALIEDYAKHLLARPALLIESESGGGKSSLAAAGVIPSLQQKRPAWLLSPRLTPGAHPVQALQEALRNTPGLGLTGDITADAVREALGERCLVLFVDQLEELLTVCTDEKAIASFSTLLAELLELQDAAAPQDGPNPPDSTNSVRLIATLRTDHHDRFAHSQACVPLFKALTADESLKTLLPMRFDEIRYVILRPAQAVGLRFVPASLVDQLANETANLAGGLPRLQFALKRLWALRPTYQSEQYPEDNPKGLQLDLIDQSAFTRLPSVSEALGTVAQDLLDSLPADERATVERLMLELTVLDEQSEGPLRRRRLQAELLLVLQKAGRISAERAQALIDLFVGEGLLVRTGEGEACQVEVAHESLFRHWKTFGNWINKDRARGRLKDIRLIARDAQQWTQNDRSADYLRLKGEPLDRALEYKREVWLDDASEHYCDVCQHARQQQWTAEVWRRRQIWALAVMGLTLFVGGISVYLRGVNGEHKRLAAAVNFASLIGQIEPLDALDLAFTLAKKSPEAFISPLAHATDRLEGSKLFTPDQETDFSASGRALVQRVPRSAPGQGKPGVQIWPMDDDGNWWNDAVRIDIEGDADDPGSPRLAWVDVSAPLRTTQGEDKRLVLLTFVKPSATGKGPNIFTRVALYEVARGVKDSGLLGEYVFQSDHEPHRLSEAAFNRQSGAVLLSALRYPDSESAPTHQLLSLSRSGNRALKVEYLKNAVGHPSNTDNQGVVSAIAESDSAMPDGKPLRVTGRLDGTVFCGDIPLQRADTSYITRLKVAGSWFVAQHFSGRLVIGNCNEPDKGLVGYHQGKSDAEQPGSLALLSSGEGHKLSFIDGQKLCELSWTANEWPKLDDMKSCWVSGLDANQVMPVYAPAQGHASYWALPDRKRSWLVPLAGTPVAPMRGVTPVATAGLPVGQPADTSKSGVEVTGLEGPPAAAGELASAGIRSSNSGQGRRVWRRVGVGAVAQPIPLDGVVDLGFDPTAVAINPRGDVVVLGSNGQLLVHSSAKGESQVVPLAFRPVCMSLSAGGDQLVVSGQTGARLRVRLSENPSKDLESETLAVGGREGVSLVACAIANNGATVSGFQDGRVIYHGNRRATVDKKGEDGSLELNSLVQFKMSGGIQALSIDASGRFVAALGKSSRKSCSSSVGGRPLRVWDLNRQSAFPVASVCLPGGQVRAIGPLTLWNDDSWKLDVFEVDEQQKVWKSPYICLACDVVKVDLDASGSSELSRRVNEFKPKKLEDVVLLRAYGIEP